MSPRAVRPLALVAMVVGALAAIILGGFGTVVVGLAWIALAYVLWSERDARARTVL